jgi:hypothetical protein
MKSNLFYNTDQTESILVVEIELVVGEQVLHSIQLIDFFLAAFHQLQPNKTNFKFNTKKNKKKHGT